MVKNQNKQDKEEIVIAGEEEAASYEPAFDSKAKYFGVLALNFHTLFWNFMTLYDKRYEKELPQNIKHERDTAESVIFWSSIGGRLFAVTHVARNLSFLNSLPFKPLRDMRVVLVALGALYLCDVLPISYYYPKFEDMLIKRIETKEITHDFEKETNLSKYKLWYYNAFF